MQTLNSSPKKKNPLRKRLVFAAIPLIILLVAATVFLSSLEKQEVIQTESPDDVVLHDPLHLLRKIQHENQDYWEFGDQGMVRGKVPVKKDNNTIRIVCVGGSFLMGFPYTLPGMPNPGYAGIPHWLQLELAMRYPSRKIEVINLATSGQNSSRVFGILQGIPPLQPDLVLIATGNNEGNLAPTAFNKALHKWIVYRALKKTLLRPPTPAEREPFMPQDPDVQKIERNFQENIRRMIDFCQRQRLPLFLATVPINLRYFGSIKDTYQGGLSEPADDPWLIKGREKMEQCELDKALKSFAESKSQAYALIYMAQCYDEQRQYDKASDLYRAHVQLNPLFRTRPSYNEYVRELADEGGFHLIDLERQLEQRSEGGIPNIALFLDYCHFKWWGNQMMSRLVATALSDSDLIFAADSEPLPAPGLRQIIETYHLEKLYERDDSWEHDLFIERWENGRELPPHYPHYGCEQGQ